MRKLLYIFCIVIVLVLFVGCTSKRPEISEQALAGSAQIIKGNGEVKDTEVIVDESTIKFYMVPTDESVSKERLRELGLDFIKVLAGYTVNEELSGPTEESYGEIYDYYNIEIIVEGEHGAVLDKATKAKGKNEVIWQE